MADNPVSVIKEPYTIIGDQKIIIDYAAIYCRTPQELLKSGLFREILARFIKRIEQRKTPGFLFLRERRPDLPVEEIPDYILRLLRLLVGHTADEIISLNPEYLAVLQGDDREWLYELRRDLYNYWRRIERYIFLEMPRGAGRGAVDIHHDNFIASCENLKNLILHTNRMIGEHLSGKDPKVYRQLPAGANMGMLVERIAWQVPPFLAAFKDVPFIRISLIEPPLILYSKSNTRKGTFDEVSYFPPNGGRIDPREWFCFPAKVGTLTAFIFFHHDYIAQALAMSNLFEIADHDDIDGKQPDLVVLFGVPGEGMNGLTEFYEHPTTGIITGLVQHSDDVGYFGYFKKMTLTVHNVAMLKRGHLPLHGAMVHIKLKDGGEANLAFVGDSGAGKSETLEALRTIADEHFSDIKVIFDDMGSLAAERGKVNGYGTEIGAFVRLDDLHPKYAYDEVDRSIFINPDRKNARLVMPITAHHHVVKGYPLDMLFYANNYEDLDAGHPAVDFFPSAEKAIEVFRSGARQAKGTTDEKGLVHTYFANPFGAHQRHDLHEKVASEMFDSMFASGVKVGQIRTRLGIHGMEQEGPKAVAQQLYEIIKRHAAGAGK